MKLRRAVAQAVRHQRVGELVDRERHAEEDDDDGRLDQELSRWS